MGDWRRRQEELLAQKQVAWQIQKCERENRLTSARETRRRQELERRVYQRHLEIDRQYKERCRNLEIEKRESEWEPEENARLTTLHAEAKAQNEAREQALAVEKARKCEEFRDECAARSEQQRKDAELNRK